jgi:DNA-binding MarR family transcriptional regulator
MTPPITPSATAVSPRQAGSRVSSVASAATIAGPAPQTRSESSSRRITTHELSSDVRVAVARLSRRIRAEKADGALSDGQYSVLALLFREGEKTLGELAEHERVTPPSMNRTVNKLESAGYVVREASSDDRRKVLFVPTDAGRELVKETRRRRDAWLDRRLAKLPPATRALLADAALVMRELADS